MESSSGRTGKYRVRSYCTEIDAGSVAVGRCESPTQASRVSIKRHDVVITGENRISGDSNGRTEWNIGCVAAAIGLRHRTEPVTASTATTSCLRDMKYRVLPLRAGRPHPSAFRVQSGLDAVNSLADGVRRV